MDGKLGMLHFLVCVCWLHGCAGYMAACAGYMDIFKKITNSSPIFELYFITL